MRQDWKNTNSTYTGESLQLSRHEEGYRVLASSAARSEFGWLIDKAPEWAECNLDFITDLDITGGVDPSTLDDAKMEEKVHEFVIANPSMFEGFTEESMGYFIAGASRFARYGADGAQGFKLKNSDEFRTVLFIQSISGRDFPEISKQGLGVPIEMSAFDDAALTIMHECAHLLKQHSQTDQMEALSTETEAEGLAIASFVQSVNEGRNLDLRSLQPRLAFRSLQSVVWNGKRAIENINDPLGSEEGFSHGMSAGLSLVNSPLTGLQATALLRAPIQVNTLVHWLTNNDEPDRREYFSAMAALYLGGHLGENTLAEVYVGQALQACQNYAGEWLDKDFIENLRAKLVQTDVPNVEWDQIQGLFDPKRGTYIDPAVSASDIFENNFQFDIA